MSRAAPVHSYKIPGPAGELEVLYRPSADGLPAAGALLCHPHPLYGGSLHTRVLHHMARAFHEAGHAVLRFNFRGVGLSAGSFDGGEGELEDARAALDHLAERHPGLPLVAGGHSFGSWVGLRLGVEDARVGRLLGVGVPLSLFPFRFLEGAGKPLLLVQGERDPFGSPAEVCALAAAVGPGARAVVIEGGDHMLAGSEDRLRGEIAADFA